MPFFAPLPEPEPVSEVDHRQYDWPTQRPDHWLPGVGSDTIVLARTATTAVVLSAGEVYPRGLVLRLLLLAAPRSASDVGPYGVDSLDPWGYSPRGGLVPGALRIGLEWADGGRVESGPWGGPFSEPEDGYQLTLHGGGGSESRRDLEMWLTPLPPAEPVTAHLLWEARGIEEKSVVWDLAPVVARAVSAQELWHLDPPPAEGAFGWMAYSPMGTLVVQEHGDIDEASQEDVDGAPED